MSFIGPVLGAGQIHYGAVLRGNVFVTDFSDALTKVGIELQFFSKSGELTGVIGSQYEKSNLVNLEIKDNKIGGIEEFTFQIGRLIDIPFFNDQEVRLYYNNQHWFTGFLKYQPGQDKRDVLYEFEGKGGISFLEKINIDLVYNNKTINYILNDLVENYLTPNSPILYNDEQIDAPDITLTKIEFNNNTLDKVMETILAMSNENYDTIQYRYYINKEKEFVFERINTSVRYGFFEGYQFQEPEVEINSDEIVNIVRVWRNNEDTDTMIYINEYQNSDSVDLWGERIRKLTVPNYVTNDTAERIANAIINRKKNAIIKEEITNLLIEDMPYPIGFYNLFNRQTNYIDPISNFERLSDWTKNINNTTIATDSSRNITGQNSYKCNLTSGSNGESIEFELDDAIYFPEKIILYVNQEEAGEYFDFFIYDDDGNVESIGQTLFIITNENERIITDAGIYIISNDRSLRIDIESDFFRLELPIFSLNNVKKFKIIFISNENIRINFDRLDVKAFIWKTNNLISDSFTYMIENANIKVNGVFGEKMASIVDDIEEISDKQQNVIDIFEKTS